MNGEMYLTSKMTLESIAMYSVPMILLVVFTACSPTKAQEENAFDTEKLATDLEQMAKTLEQSLATNKDNLPLLDVVKDFQADTIGLVITTAALQAAIDSCAQNAPGRVFFPKGLYLTGTLILKSGVHLEFEEGTKILGSTDLKDYPEIYPKYKSYIDKHINKSLFYAEGVDNISMTGKAIINFQGTSPVYANTFNDDPKRPLGIRIISSKNIYLNGMMLMNSGKWMQHYLDCENVMLENLSVFNHATNNNDGINIDGSRNIYVRNSQIDSDDDGICLKSTGPSPCENILIEDCTVASHCNALKLGTETTGGFKNVLYRNCKVIPSVTGHHHINGIEDTRTTITLIITDGGKMENIWFDNIDAIECGSSAKNRRPTQRNHPKG